MHPAKEVLTERGQISTNNSSILDSHGRSCGLSSYQFRAGRNTRGYEQNESRSDHILWFPGFSQRIDNSVIRHGSAGMRVLGAVESPERNCPES